MNLVLAENRTLSALEESQKKKTASRHAGIPVHTSKVVDPEFQAVNQNESKVTMPASFLNNQSAGTVDI